MNAFRAWLEKHHPMLCAIGADKMWPGVVDGMERAWDAAIEASTDIAGRAATRAIESDGVGRASDRLAEVTQAIGALETGHEERTTK